MNNQNVYAVDRYVEACIDNCGIYRHALKLSDGRTLYAFSDSPDADVTFISDVDECDSCRNSNDLSHEENG